MLTVDDLDLARVMVRRREVAAVVGAQRERVAAPRGALLGE